MPAEPHVRPLGGGRLHEPTPVERVSRVVESAGTQARTDRNTELARVTAQRNAPTVAPSRPPPRKAPSAAPDDALGIAVRDAIDHGRILVRDSVALGFLEVRRGAGKLIPRVAWGGVAATSGVAGVVILIVAGFIALEAVIPPVAARLVIVALVLLAIAAFGAWRAMRGLKEKGTEHAEPVMPPVSPPPGGGRLHPGDGVEE